MIDDKRVQCPRAARALDQHAGRSRLYLQQHIFACGVPDVVLLDLRRNRYLALPEHQSRLLAQLVPGWPYTPEPETDVPRLSDASAAKIVNELLDQEILTTTPLRGKPATPAVIASATRTLVSQPKLIPEPSDSKPYRAHHLPALVRAALTAAAQLRFSRVEQIVLQVAARRGRVGRCSVGAVDSTTAALVADFYWLRPFVFTGRQKCLHHSLTLLHFLANFGVHPQWVFGIRKAPFGAHCWVQEGDTVCNDVLEHVAMFTPIMIV